METAPAPRWTPADGLKSCAQDRKLRPMDSYEAAHAAGHTVFLGSDVNFDYWGNPETGWTTYIGNPGIGCASGSMGDRGYWRSIRHLPSDSRRYTPAGLDW